VPISSFGAAHAAAALTALAFGFMVLAMRKGTQLHRAIGMGYATAMVAVNGTALTIHRLTGHFGPFHALAILSLATVVAGVAAAVLRPRNWLVKHYRMMSFSYLGLLAATTAEIAIRVPALHVNSPARGMTTGIAIAVLFTAAGSVILRRLQRRALAAIVAD
jgi:uncharacterized membrane protein